MKGCKNCPAYAKCTVTYRGSACAALRGTYGIDDDPEIVTNADRIRAMSDEELAGYLAEISGGTVLKMAAQLGIPLDQEKNERYIDRLKEEYLKRLQQPAEGGRMMDIQELIERLKIHLQSSAAYNNPDLARVLEDAADALEKLQSELNAAKSPEVLEAVDELVEFARTRMGIAEWLYYVDVLGEWRGQKED